MRNMFKNFLKYTPLLVQLVQGNLAKKYKNSFLGYAWSLLNPLFMMMVLSFVFSYIFKNSIENFPIYLILGQTLWGFLSEGTNTAMKAINSSSALIKKVYIPKYIFPFSKVMTSFVSMVFSALAVLIAILITKTHITITVILFPLALFYTFIFVLGMGLILCVINVYFRDTEHLYSVVLLAWMYCTPIFYPVKNLPEQVRRLIFFNPMYHFITYMRMVVLYGEVPTLQYNLLCLMFGLVPLAIGLFIFYKNQDGFILHM